MLFRAGLSLLRCLEPALLAASNVGAVYDLLRSTVEEENLKV